MSPLPRLKRNHPHCGSFQVSLDFSMASNQTARGVKSASLSEKSGGDLRVGQFRRCAAVGMLRETQSIRHHAVIGIFLSDPKWYRNV